MGQYSCTSCLKWIVFLMPLWHKWLFNCPNFLKLFTYECIHDMAEGEFVSIKTIQGNSLNLATMLLKTQAMRSGEKQQFQYVPLEKSSSSSLKINFKSDIQTT